MQTLPHAPSGAQPPVLESNNLTSALIEALPAPQLLETAIRFLDDIGPRHARMIADQLGGDPTHILETPGYGLATVEFARTLRSGKVFSGSMPHGQIILPCRDAEGQIVALHDLKMSWLTPPATHIANAVRSQFAEIQICATTSEADTIALRSHVCAIARNGLDNRVVEAAVLSAMRFGTSHASRTVRARSAQALRLAA